MTANDALRLDLMTMAMHGNAVVVKWVPETGRFLVAACDSSHVAACELLKHCVSTGHCRGAASIGDAVGHLHDIVMDEEKHEQHGN